MTGGRSGDYAQASELDRDTHSKIYKAGTYDGSGGGGGFGGMGGMGGTGCYALSSFTIDRSAHATFSGSESAHACSSLYTLAQSIQDTGTSSQHEHGEGTYGAGSYSYTTYANDYDARATHTASGSGIAGTYSAAKTEYDYRHNQWHAQGLGQLGTQINDSLETYQNSLMSLPSITLSHTTSTFSMGGMLTALPDANGLGIITGNAPTSPHLQGNTDSVAISSAEVRLEAKSGNGSSVAGTNSDNTSNVGLLPARLIKPESVGIKTAAALQLVRKSVSLVQADTSWLANSKSTASDTLGDDESSTAKSRLLEQTGGLTVLSNVQSVADVLAWLKKAMNAGAFAAAAGQLNGPGAAMSNFSSWLSDANGYSNNRITQPGKYAAVSKYVEQNFPYLFGDAKEQMIDQIMHPEKYQSSGQEEKDDRNLIERKIDQGYQYVKKKVKQFADATIKYNPFVQGIKLFDQDTGRSVEKWLINRQDKLGAALDERVRGLGHAITHPLDALEGMVKSMVESPLERFQKFADDPEKAIYGLAIDAAVTRGMIKSPVKGGSASRAGRATEGGTATRAADAAPKTKPSTPNPIESRSPKAPAEAGAPVGKQGAAGAKPGQYPSLPVLQKSCFAAGTMLLTPEGEKPIESFLPGDLVLSRSEHDPDGPIEARLVTDTFTRVSMILELQVRGKMIRTTAEHPFYVPSRGWIPAGMLREGDQLISHDGSIRGVERVVETREVTTVYNLEVEDYHTYFVGSAAWGFSVWAHNAEYSAVQGQSGKWQVVNKEGEVVRDNLSRGRAEKLADRFNSDASAVTSTRPGTRGRQDHRDDVNGPGQKQAESQAGPLDTVKTEKPIEGFPWIKRRADNQVIGPDGKTRIVVESERRPNGTYHKKRIKQLEDAGIEVQTRPPEMWELPE